MTGPHHKPPARGTRLTTATHFSLRPFPSEQDPLPMRVTGNLTRRGANLTVRFSVLADLAGLQLPDLAPHPHRQRHLWEATCMEFFLGVPGTEAYWEFNLSPAGHWNVFRFDSYRLGMLEETGFSSLPFIVVRKPSLLQMDLTFDLSPIATPKQRLRMAVGTVLRDSRGRMTYWALAHPASEPDFHHADSFLISI